MERLINDIPQEWIEASMDAAKAASETILSFYDTSISVSYKQDESPVTAADKSASKVILSHLEKTGIPILSEEEEMIPYADRVDEEWIWIVDPLDGTREFIRKNDEFCVCIALIRNHQPVFGLIASPTDQDMLCGGKEMGSYHFDFDTAQPFTKEHQLPSLLAVDEEEELTIAHSRSHLSKKTAHYIDQLSQEETSLIRKGSALKFFDLATGKATIYPRLAPTMEWDIAAGHAIYQGVGGCVLDFTNFEPLQYNKADLYNPHFIAKPKNLTL